MESAINSKRVRGWFEMDLKYGLIAFAFIGMFASSASALWYPNYSPKVLVEGKRFVDYTPDQPTSLIHKWMFCSKYHSAFCIGRGAGASQVSDSLTTTTLPCFSSSSSKRC